MRLFERFLDETCHQDVALHVDVLTQPEPAFRRAQADLHGFFGLVGQSATERPLALDV